jgi:histidinol-phosphate aminotransferase
MKKRLLNRNEIIKEPSPAVSKAIRDFDPRKASRYFDGYYGSSLIPELAQRFKLPLDRISVGYGIEFFLRAIFDSLDPRRDVILANAPHYGFYSVYARSRKIKLATFQILDRGDHFEFDMNDCVQKIKRLRPKVILLTSPNNPTGNSVGPRAIANILHVTQATKIGGWQPLVVLDEAYWGFDPDYNEKATMRLLKKYENLIILRSFSKRYALAGLRIGFALWGSRAKEIIRYDNLYLGGSRLLEAAAVAALRSEPYYAKLSRTVITERELFTARISRLKNFTPYVSNANFVMVRMDKKAIPEFKKRSDALNVTIWKFTMPEFIRVSLGLPKYNRQFAALLELIDKAVIKKSLKKHA